MPWRRIGLEIIIILIVEVGLFGGWQFWQKRSTPSVSENKTVTLNGMLERYGDGPQSSYVIIGDGAYLVPIPIQNATHEPVKIALDAVVGQPVTANGVFFPDSSTLFYLTKLNQQPLEPVKTALTAGIPTIQTLLASQPKRAEAEACLKQSLGNEYDATLAKTYPELTTDNINKVSDCFRKITDSPSALSQPISPKVE
ncbi:MAG: hypothetical protein AAB647_00360 [Patescibacteria group bacterium]